MEIAEPHHEHHVHFSSSDDLADNEIVVRHRNINIYEIQLGFLQVNHTYEVVVRLGANVGEGLDLETFAQKEVPVPIHCKLLRIQRTGDSTLLIFNFKAMHDKVTREKMVLAGTDDSSIQFEIVARVLGRGKGTPMLRSGIKCIGVEPVEDTDDSDWQGF